MRVIVSALALKVFADTFGAIPQAGMYVTSVIGNVALTSTTEIPIEAVCNTAYPACPKP